MFIAHRGKWSKFIKENSIDAFKDAINDSFYEGFELDIRETNDHEFVVVHDFIYKNHLISKTDLNTLKKMGLCSLKEVLELDTNKLILIDIKDEINIDNFINLISLYNKNVYIMSYNKKVIKSLIDKNIYDVGLLSLIYNNNYKDYHFLVVLNNTLNCDIIDQFYKKNIPLFFYGIIDRIKHYNKNNYYIIDDNNKNKLILESDC